MSEFQWSEYETNELKDKLNELDGMVKMTFDQAMNDCRPNIEETPIPSMGEKYEEHYYNVQSELINRKEI